MPQLPSKCMLILGIESTCDETAAAIVRDGKEVLGHTVASSADIHQKYGGVFPELACRRHIDVILPVIAETLQQAGISGNHLDAIAVARGPGLIGALLIGLQAAKGLSISWNKPLIGINHVEAHMYAAMMNQEPPMPSLGFVLSGGHTLMLKVLEIGRYELLGTTVDDAIGEAFDKVATLLHLSYPGGAALEQLAERGNPSKYHFPPPRVKRDPLAYSFSGLKTSVLYATRAAPEEDYPHIAAAFQEAAFSCLLERADLVLSKDSFRSLIFGGGVCNNQKLRTLFSKRFSNMSLFWPPAHLCSDNAIMIAGLAYHQWLRSGAHTLDLEALPNLGSFCIENELKPQFS